MGVLRPPSTPFNAVQPPEKPKLQTRDRAYHLPTEAKTARDPLVRFAMWNVVKVEEAVVGVEKAKCTLCRFLSLPAFIYFLFSGFASFHPSFDFFHGAEGLKPYLIVQCDAKIERKNSNKIGREQKESRTFKSEKRKKKYDDVIAHRKGEKK